MKKLIPVFVLLTVLASCRKDEAVNPTDQEEGPYLVFKFTLDSTQVRLDNLGNPSTVPAGNSAQSPRFNGISANYIEMAPNQWTPLGNGEVAYLGEYTDAGGSDAIDHSKALITGNGEVFIKVPLSEVTPGTYEYLRVSLSYQNYDVDFRINTPYMELTGTLASFVGFDTYIDQFNIKDSTVDVHANRLQGFWGFETIFTADTGQAPPGATTVPNPLFATSPIPAGSCVVTGQFDPGALTITGNETEDVIVNMSVSTNNSFEWSDADSDGWYEPLDGDEVVDMGLRGLIPKIE